MLPRYKEYVLKYSNKRGEVIHRNTFALNVEHAKRKFSESEFSTGAELLDVYLSDGSEHEGLH